MVVMCTWLGDIALASVLNGGRFDLGFYAGRVYGLLAGSFVLVVLLLENGVLYARLAASRERERRQRQLVRERSAELTTANRDLEAFSYSVSHDLRAPLRAMDGYAKMLEEDYSDALGAEGRRLLGVVRGSGARMGQLIDDLLAFARLGRQPLSTRQVALGELVQETIDELRPQCAGRSVEFIVGELGAAEADPALLRQVLANLIGNAVKYSGKQSNARIAVGRDGEIYHVRDNGAGFDMRYAERLFGVFQRLHRAQEFEGTGVGLAIVRRIVERHGGRIWAESAPGAGAAFYFTLRSSGGATISSANR
jgi:light-regulated signal transduction histidine kinase (bacteriophytochrome)